MFRVNRLGMSVLLAVLLVVLSSVLVSAQSEINLPLISNAPSPVADNGDSVEPPAVDNDGFTDDGIAVPSAPDAWDVNRWRVRDNLGIGTQFPTAKLDINYGGTGKIKSGTPLGNGPGWIFFAANGHRRDLTAWNGGFYLGASSTSGGASSSQFVLRENGNVGIGTTNPQSKLDINFGSTGHMMAGTPLGNGPGWILYAPNGHRRDAAVSNVGYSIAVSSGSGAANPALMITEAGRVGIGTLVPVDRLEVKNGNIRVTNGSFIDDGMTLLVPDYVFEDDYELMSLDELQAFTMREKHLPNVPSMEDIQANGLNISEFNMQLLEKVEELTLYTFQQQQQIDALEARIEALEAVQH